MSVPSLACVLLWLSMALWGDLWALTRSFSTHTTIKPLYPPSVSHTDTHKHICSPVSTWEKKERDKNGLKETKNDGKREGVERKKVWLSLQCFLAAPIMLLSETANVFVLHTPMVLLIAPSFWLIPLACWIVAKRSQKHEITRHI